MYSWEPGNRVWWRANGGHVGAGRYSAVVCKVSPKRVTIEFVWRPSGEWVRATTLVKPENLSPRDKLCEHLGECETTNV